MTKRTCTIPGCDKPHDARGMCRMHYTRWQKHGDPHTVKVDWDTDRRFRSFYTVADTGCWEWQGNLSPEGYGRWTVRGERIGVHRWSYERHVGPIPAGLVIDHLCRNPRCVNPEHLEPVPQRENVSRAPTALPTINAAKTHCKRGHAFTPENTKVTVKGSRQCRECVRASNRESQRRRRAEARTAG